MNIPALLAQIVVSLVVVTLYHLWVSRQKLSAPVLPVVVAPIAAAPVVAAPVVAAPKAPPPSETIQPEMLAVIAAAIAVVLGRPHRVVSVQQETAQMTEVNIWALEGRVEQFLSHKIR